MPPGVEIDRTGSDGAGERPGSGSFEALATVRAVGSDRDRNVEVTLDGTGRLTEIHVRDVVVTAGRRAVEQSVRQAFDAAFADLDRQRQDRAAEMIADGRARVAGLTDRLQALSDHADRRLADALEQMKEQARRMGGAT